MANRSILCAATMVLVFLATVPGIPAQSSEEASISEPLSGICTDRLTSKQLRIWREVERIAEATDKAGQPLHPRLHSLWQWAKGSGHTITIEMAERRLKTNMGGRTTQEQGPSNGLHPVAILCLHRWAIENASVNPTVHRPDGLMPFYRLGLYERYAEVVGHELTHAFLMLENPEYARLCSEINMEAAALIVAWRQSGNGAAQRDMTRQRQVRLQSMYDRIERPAEATELEIWRELRDGRRRGGRTSNGIDSSWTAMLLNLSNGNGFPQ